MSALLGRIPSAVGYQPTLATDLGQLQERITTTSKGSITSVQVRARRAAHACGGQQARLRARAAGCPLAGPNTWGLILSSRLALTPSLPACLPLPTHLNTGHLRAG